MKALHLAGEEDAAKLLPLVSAFHEEMRLNTTEAKQSGAVLPLLSGTPHGAIWLIGPRRAPVGYIAVSFGWSLELGGMDAFIDELYIRPAVRRRGMGSEALNSIAQALRDADVKALHLEVDKDNPDVQGIYRRARFAMRDRFVLMTREL